MTITNIRTHQLTSEMEMILLHPSEYQCKEYIESFKNKYILKIHLTIHSSCVPVKSFAFLLVLSLMYFAVLCWAMNFTSINTFRNLFSMTILLVLSFIVTVTGGYKCTKYNQICSSKNASTDVLYLSLDGTFVWCPMLWVTFAIETYGPTDIQATKQQINKYKNINNDQNLSINATRLTIPANIKNIRNNDFDSNSNMNASRIGYKSIKQIESVSNERYTTHLIIAIMQALIGAFLSGYNIAVSNVQSLAIHTECQLNICRYSSLQAFYFFNGFFGAISIVKAAVTFTRNCPVIIFDTIFIISGVLLYGYSWTFFGKCSWILYSIFAIGSGIGITIISMYIGEISPLLIRGFRGSIAYFSIKYFNNPLCNYIAQGKPLNIFSNEKLFLVTHIHINTNAIHVLWVYKSGTEFILVYFLKQQYVYIFRCNHLGWLAAINS